MSLVCPIYNSSNACTQHSNCLFLRQGGCAIILAMNFGAKNQELLEKIDRRLSAVEQNIRTIANALNRR